MNHPAKQTRWEQTNPDIHSKWIWRWWFATWIGLLIGLFDQTFYHYVVLFSAVHILVFLYFFGFQIKLFPIQVRLAYLTWVIIGTYVPGMLFLMYITTIGLASNLFIGYCPLARILYLLPWNHTDQFSLSLVKHVFFSAPQKGKLSL